MIDNSKEMKVKNRSAVKVGYTVPNRQGTRTLEPGQVAMIPYGELVDLSFQPGGKSLMANYLLITDPDMPEYKNPTAEPEYYYTDQEIIKLIKEGSLDEFLDALDFAPVGVIDLIKKYAVELPINDIQKRDAIKEKLHYDVEAIIANSNDSTPIEDEATTSGRRVKKKTSAVAAEDKPKRRAKAKTAE